LLAREAKYNLLVQSDGDICVGPRYLREIAASFESVENGVVSCLYRGVAQENVWAEFEALGSSTDFSGGVLVAAWMEGVTFALGASIATTKGALARIGGYQALANVLADDYELGNRISKFGGRAMLSREVVATMYPAVTFRTFWEHQSRWARTVRLCRPASYVGLLFTHGLPWAILGALVSHSLNGIATFFAGYVVLRLGVSYTVGVWGLRDQTVRRKWWLLPFRDAVQFAVWLGGFFSDRIKWGQSEFQLTPNGEMTAITSSDEKSADSPLHMSRRSG
jgi:ceramide glucosyltransferase